MSSPSRWLFRGVELQDWPMCVRMRLTECRQRGHHFGLHDAYYCMNCASPWCFKIITDPPKQGRSTRREAR